MTAPATNPIRPDILADSGMVHVVCCRDGDVSLCGYQPDDGWVDGDGDVCVVCDDLESVSIACPLGGTCKLYAEAAS